MKRPSENREREDRFTDEVVVDAYGEEERAMGWDDYAADNIAFPFKARCVLKRATSPLKAGDVVEVTGMAPEDDCMQELMVSDQVGRRGLGCSAYPVGIARLNRLDQASLGRLEVLGGQRLHVLSEERRLIL